MRSWWTTSPKQRLSDMLQWMESDFSFLMWIRSLDKNKTRRTFTCWDLWVWKHLKTTRSIYIILYLYLWYFDFRYFACCESATMHEHRAQGCQARGFALPVFSGSPSHALSKCCYKECFLIDSNPASFAGTAQRAVFGGSLVLLIGSWHLVPPCSGGALPTGPLSMKSLDMSTDSLKTRTQTLLFDFFLIFRTWRICPIIEVFW